MKSIITELTNCLDSTIWAWENFQQGDIQYFYHLCDSLPDPKSPESEEIGKIFDELRKFQRELGKVKKEISDDFSNAVKTSLHITGNTLILIYASRS